MATPVPLAPAAARLAAFATEVTSEEVPLDVRRDALLHLLDTVGCGLAARALGVADQGLELSRADGGSRRASAIGLATRVPAPAAAFANGMLCHGLDFDDTHAGAIAHVGTVLGPAALAAAEAAGASGAKFVTALVAGTEVVARLGAAAAPAYMRKGFHPTSVCGVFGATAAAARLFGLPTERTVAALGIAGSMASGLFEYLSEGTETKPMHAAWAAHGGVVAARLAVLGAAGPSTVLEGRFGVFASYYDDASVDLDRHLADLGTRWETSAVSLKPYPACHFVHSCVEAARLLRAERALDPATIREVRVSIPEPGVPLVLEPVEHKRRPRTPYDAKFSLPYSVAAMLVHGRLDVGSYTPAAIEDAAVLSLASRVVHVPGDFRTYRRSFPGRVELELDDGTTLAGALEHEPGSPENPLAPDIVRAKFCANASLALARKDVEALERAILGLDDAPDLASLEPLRRARRKEEA